MKRNKQQERFLDLYENPLFETGDYNEVITSNNIEFLECVFPLAPSLNGEQLAIREFLPKYLIKEDAELILGIKDILSKVSADDLRKLVDDIHKSDTLMQDLKNGKVYITSLHVLLSSQSERDSIYSLSASMLVDKLYHKELVEVYGIDKPIPLTYCLTISDDTYVTHLMDISRGFEVKVGVNSEDNFMPIDDMKLNITGICNCIYTICRGLATRVTLNDIGVDYFDYLSPIHQILEM